MMRNIIYLLLLLPLHSFAQDWKFFNDTSILFTARYSADWINKIKEKTVFFTSPAESEDDDFFQNVNIKISTHPDYGTKLKVTDVGEEIVDNVKKSFIEFTEESRTLLKWNGIDAFEITYSGNIKSNETMWVRITQRVCFYKTRFYLLTYTALKNRDVHAATAKKIINSIKFRP